MAIKTGKRELIEPHPGDKRYMKRDKLGRFKSSVDVSKSLSHDDRIEAKHTTKPGYGDRGDELRKRPRTKK